jgi:hypothetical protein
MVEWWFRNIGGEMEVEGRTFSRYHVWHPFDHILWELANRPPDGRVGVGSRFHIVEAFNADPRYYIDIVDTVTRLDGSGVTLVGYKAGLEVSRLSHDIIAAEGGTLYRSRLTIGIGVPGLCRLVNPIIHMSLFPEDMGRAWLRHNVEEVGLLEHIVPRLHAHSPSGQSGT